MLSKATLTSNNNSSNKQLLECKDGLYAKVCKLFLQKSELLALIA